MPIDLPDWLRGLPVRLISQGTILGGGTADLTVPLLNDQTLFLTASGTVTAVVTGLTTGIVYAGVTADSGEVWTPVNPSADPSVDVSVLNQEATPIDYVLAGIPADVRRITLLAEAPRVRLEAEAPANAGPVLLSTDSAGNLLVSPSPTPRNTYSAASGVVSTAGGPSVLLSIGSAANVVTLRRLWLTQVGPATAAAELGLAIAAYSSAPTGGTLVAAVPSRTSEPAASAVCRALPTAGAFTLVTTQWFWPLLAARPFPNGLYLDFADTVGLPPQAEIGEYLGLRISTGYAVAGAFASVAAVFTEG